MFAEAIHLPKLSDRVDAVDAAMSSPHPVHIADQAVVESEVLTPAEEFVRYIEDGVVPSMYAIRRALGDERAAMLAEVNQGPRSSIVDGG